MSYIRVLDSPEGLYIVGTKVGVEISRAHRHKFKSVILSYEDWHGLIDAYNSGESEYDAQGNEVFEFNGLSVKYVNIAGHFKWVLRQKGESWWIAMWHVTWSYIARNRPSESNLWREDCAFPHCVDGEKPQFCGNCRA